MAKFWCIEKGLIKQQTCSREKRYSQYQFCRSEFVSGCFRLSQAVNSDFGAAKNCYVSSNFAASKKNGQVSSKFAAAVSTLENKKKNVCGIHQRFF